MHAIITGGSRGIGKALVELFLSKGFNIITCGRNPKDLQQLHTNIAKHYPKQTLLTYVTDLSDTNNVQQFAQFALHNAPQIDLLINNAAIFRQGTLATEPNDCLEQTMKANVYSAYHLTKQLLPQFIAQQNGHIFNICSVASNTILDNCTAYTISKHALLGFSHSLRHELKQHQVKVTTVIPGATYTSAWNGVPIDPNRLMPPEDVAQAIADCYQLSKRTVVEDIVLRPMLGDL